MKASNLVNLSTMVLLSAVTATSLAAEVNVPKREQLHIYLLMGQSNMADTTETIGQRRKATP